MKTNKLSIYNNERVIIENYDNITELLNDNIIVDKYVINGENLKIKQIDEYYIIIVGKIFYINIKDDSK